MFLCAYTQSMLRLKPFSRVMYMSELRLMPVVSAAQQSKAHPGATPPDMKLESLSTGLCGTPASDVHNMVTLYGRRAPLQNTEQRNKETSEQTGDAKPLPKARPPMRPCASCQTEVPDDPKMPINQGVCFQPGCYQRFCSRCFPEHEMHCLGHCMRCIAWMSGQCIQPCKEVLTFLVPGLPDARTNNEGDVYGEAPGCALQGLDEEAAADAFTPGLRREEKSGATR